MPRAMLNIGPVSAAWLQEIGIDSHEKLGRCGSVAAYALIRQRHPEKATLNLLWALEGAIQNRDCRDFSPEEKQLLKTGLTTLRPGTNSI